MNYIYQPKKFHRWQLRPILILFLSLLIIGLGSRMYYTSITSKPSDMPILLFVVVFALLLLMSLRYFLLNKIFKKSQLMIKKGCLIYKKGTLSQLTSEGHYDDWAFKLYKCCTIENISHNEKYCLIKGDIEVKIVDSKNTVLKTKTVKNLKINNLYAHWMLLSEALTPLILKSNDKYPSSIK